MPVNEFIIVKPPPSPSLVRRGTIKAVEKGAVECRKDLFRLDEWGNRIVEMIKERI